jgi:hypothetical protein
VVPSELAVALLDVPRPLLECVVMVPPGPVVEPDTLPSPAVTELDRPPLSPGARLRSTTLHGLPSLVVTAVPALLPEEAAALDDEELDCAAMAVAPTQTAAQMETAHLRVCMLLLLADARGGAIPHGDRSTMATTPC